MVGSLYQRLVLSWWCIKCCVSGAVSDIYGRKPVLIIDAVLTTGSTIGCSFVNGIWGLITLNVVRGATATACTYITVVYLMEFSHPNYRSISSNILILFVSFSYFMIDLFAYYVRNWRHLSTYSALPCIPILFVFMYLPESPRWLLASGSNTRAETAMRRISTFNGCSTSVIHLKITDTSMTKRYTYLDLIRNFKIFKLTASSVSIWLTIPIIYYSIAFQSSNYGGNMYESFALSSIADIPACCLSAYISNRIGRKKTNLGGLLVSGILLGSLMFVPKSLSCRYTINITIAILARFSNCVSYFGIFVWTFELFPTILRAQWLCLCAIFDRIGMFLVPFIITVVHNVHPNLPFILLAALAISTTLIGTSLPETNNKPTRERYEDFFEVTSPGGQQSGIDNMTIHDNEDERV